MAKSNVILCNRTFRFLGIGGIGVSALAVYLRRLGKEVYGYDEHVDTDLVARLKAYGIFITDNLNALPAADVTVYSGAFSEEKILSDLKGKGIILSRAQLLGTVMESFPTSVAIGGTHGKTTATAMLGEVLSGSASTLFLGGEYPPFKERGGFGNLYFEGNALCVAEACEYKESFLCLRPTVAVALNVEPDHMDYYPNYRALTDAFTRFLNGGTATVVNADDSVLCRYPASVTYGLCKKADYVAENLRQIKGNYAFDCYERGKFRGEVRLSVPGKHNVYNALAVIATARQLFVPFSVILSRLSAFSGVERRMERLGTAYGKTLFADYAHHPTEIQATAAAFSEKYGDNFAVVFQPHTYARTAYLFREFQEVLSKISHLALAKTYAAREGTGRESESAIVKALNCPYLADGLDIKNYIAALPKEIENVLFLGAGDIYEKAKEIVKSVTW